MARDERETGERALLNLGHTFGHAFEAAAGFSDKLLHGEAVALGIACAFEFSTRLGLLPTNDAGRVAHHLAAVGLPTRLSDVPALRTDADALMDLIAQDKKVKRGKLTFILAAASAQAFVANDVDPAQVRAFLAEKIEHDPESNTVCSRKITAMTTSTGFRSSSSSPACCSRSSSPAARRR